MGETMTKHKTDTEALTAYLDASDHEGPPDAEGLWLVKIAGDDPIVWSVYGDNDGWWVADSSGDADAQLGWDPGIHRCASLPLGRMMEAEGRIAELEQALVMVKRKCRDYHESNAALKEVAGSRGGRIAELEATGQRLASALATANARAEQAEAERDKAREGCKREAEQRRLAVESNEDLGRALATERERRDGADAECQSLSTRLTESQRLFAVEVALRNNAEAERNTLRAEVARCARVASKVAHYALHGMALERDHACRGCWSGDDLSMGIVDPAGFLDDFECSRCWAEQAEGGADVG